MMLEAVASQVLWTWLAFFGMPAGNNDLNILNQSPIFYDHMNGVGPKGSFFFVKDVEYKYGYYLTDDIYPDWAVFVKSFTREMKLDEKRRKFNGTQMARKDIERAFGVLQSRWHILKVSCRIMEKISIRNVMYACVILHNMILEDDGRAICEYYEETSQPSIVELSDEEKEANLNEIKHDTTHHNLRANLVEHILSVP
ncbi:uncharacterized protein LOC110919401 [Helianthus annuus]|uniref:uncharacterized protein LOC110919401 n=1 Tax=Helianthus annuus TaxID=4232 RepID=UPI000B8FF141|nr:uncharacterized protein LOC110919401 [Helianthus annuus]